MSDIVVWVPLYLLFLAYVIYRLGWKRTVTALLVLSLVILCVDQLGNFVKEATGRLRPCHDHLMLSAGLNVPVSKGGMYGFFSAHSANAFAFAAASLQILKVDCHRRYGSYAALIFLWAALVAASRVFLGKHFAGDILAGAFVGTLMGYVAGHFARKMMTSR